MPTRQRRENIRRGRIERSIKKGKAGGLKEWKSNENKQTRDGAGAKDASIDAADSVVGGRRARAPVCEKSEAASRAGPS